MKVKPDKWEAKGFSACSYYIIGGNKMRISDIAVALGISTAMTVIGFTKYGIECFITGAVLGVYAGWRITNGTTKRSDDN